MKWSIFFTDEICVELVMTSRKSDKFSVGALWDPLPLRTEKGYRNPCQVWFRCPATIHRMDWLTSYSPCSPAFPWSAQCPCSQPHCVQHGAQVSTGLLPCWRAIWVTLFTQQILFPLYYVFFWCRSWLLLSCNGRCQTWSLSPQHPASPRLRQNMQLCSTASCLSAVPRRYCYNIITILTS